MPAAAAGAVHMSSEMAPLPSDEFRQAMRQLAGGVVMVTTHVDERPWGLTISAFCSISAEPPQVLISLASRTVTCAQIQATEAFGISLLSERHLELAEVGSATGAPKFVDEYCEIVPDGSRPPRVKDALYHLDCAVVSSHQAGDHTVFIARVEQAVGADGESGSRPLIYFDQAYRQVGEDLPPGGGEASRRSR